MHLTACVTCFLLTCRGLSSVFGLNHHQQLLESRPEDDVFNPSFDSFVESTLRDLHVPGLSIAVIEDGKIASKV